MFCKFSFFSFYFVSSYILVLFIIFFLGSGKITLVIIFYVFEQKFKILFEVFFNPFVKVGRVYIYIKPTVN